MENIESAESGPFLRNLLLFCRALRASGLVVTTSQMMTLTEALSLVSLAECEDVRAVLRSILIRRRSDLKVFEALFDLFWKASTARNEAVELGRLLQEARKEQARPVLVESRGGLDEDGPTDESRPVWRLYSAAERLRYKDFARLSGRELTEVESFLKNLSWTPPERLTRRSGRARHGERVDLRRTMRLSLKSGGIPVRILRKTRKRKLRPVVLICDISGSMEAYARILLQFAFVLGKGLPRVEAFAFSTRLTRITYRLRHRDINMAIQQLSDSLTDWGSGTRIGAALKAFNFEWGRRVLSESPLVMIVSDGWDRGDVGMLEREMDRLHRSCHRLIWLNPLLGSPGYRPLTRGIRAALPYMDHFLPVHNLASLEQLGAALADLSKLDSGLRGVTGGPDPGVVDAAETGARG